MKLAEIIGGAWCERYSPLLVWRRMEPFGDECTELGAPLNTFHLEAHVRLWDYGTILNLVQALL